MVNQNNMCNLQNNLVHFKDQVKLLKRFKNDLSKYPKTK